MSEVGAPGARRGKAANNKTNRTWPTYTDASRPGHDQDDLADEEAPELPIARSPIEAVLKPGSIEPPVFRNMGNGTHGGRLPTTGHLRQQAAAPSRTSTSDEETFLDETDVETPLLKHSVRPTSPSYSSSCSTTTASPDHNPTNPFIGGVTVPQFRLIFAVVCSTFFIACFDATILASSHPVITSYFGASNNASWLSTAFLLTSTTFQPLIVRYTDSVGRKWPYVVTMSIFAAATVWCASAGSMTSLIVARAACGFGAGGAMSCGGVLVGDLVPIE